MAVKELRSKSLICSKPFVGLSMLALINPGAFPYIGLGFLDTVFAVFKVFMVILFLFNIPSFAISTHTILVTLMYMVMTFSTIINSQMSADYMLLFGNIASTIALCLLTDYCMQRNPLNFLKATILVCFVLLTINLITIILYPNGLYADITTQNWLLGYDNSFIIYLVPFIGFCLIYSQIVRGKMITGFSVLAMLLGLFTEFLVWSASGIVIILLMMACVFGINLPFVQKCVRPGLVIGAFYILTFLIVFLRVVDVLGFLVVDILQKNLTFSGRTFLWDHAIGLILENPLLGVGFSGFAYKTNVVQTQPHCLILRLLCEGGIVMFSIFAYILHRFSRNISKFLQEPVAKIILITVAAFLYHDVVNSMMAGRVWFFGFLVLSSYLPQLTGSQQTFKREFVRLIARR